MITKKKAKLTFPHIPNSYVSHYRIFRRLKGDVGFSFLDEMENPTELSLVPCTLTGHEIEIDRNVITLPDYLYFHHSFPPVVKYDGVELTEVEMTYNPTIKKIFLTDVKLLKDLNLLTIEAYQNRVCYEYYYPYTENYQPEYEYQVELVFRATHQIGTHYKLY